jgi:hypothetical protein
LGAESKSVISELFQKLNRSESLLPELRGIIIIIKGQEEDVEEMRKKITLG